jgi:hypothetical protein
MDDDDLFDLPSPCKKKMAFGRSMSEKAQDWERHHKLCSEVNLLDDGDSSSDSEEEDDTRRHRRRKVPSGRMKSKNLAHLLMTGAINDLTDDKSLSSEDEDEKERTEEQIDVLDDSSSSSCDDASQSYIITPTRIETFNLLNKADNALQSLDAVNITTWNNSLTSIEDEDIVLTDCNHPPMAEDKITLRIRCKSIVHKFPIQSNQQLSTIVAQLADALNVLSDQIILQFKSTDLLLTDTPKSLNISSADILDAFVIDKPITSTNENISVENPIRIKIQTQKKFIIYMMNEVNGIIEILCKLLLIN